MQAHVPTSDFYEALEPSPEHPRDIAAEALGSILEKVFRDRRPIQNPEAAGELISRRLSAGYRSFTALTYVLRPDLLPGNGSLPMWRYAEALGITRQQMSSRCVMWSDFLGGMRTAGMRSPTAREIYKTCNSSNGSTKKKRSATTIGHERKDKHFTARNAEMIAKAAQELKEGKPWSVVTRDVLKRCGLMDGDEMLTEEGRKVFCQEAPTPPPTPPVG